MWAAYVFRVRFRLAPQTVTVEPTAFETTVRYPAPDPGEPGWRFFRDHLWRGAVPDDHLREPMTEWLSVPVESVSFSELETDEAYLGALREAVAADLDAFNADDVDEALHKYLGSSVRVRER